jgi:hypothetical protein
MRYLTSLVLVSFFLPSVQARHDTIDEAFEKAAPALLAKLKERGATNVGVLKFMVQKGTAKPADAVGELNQGLADRLEAALILASDDDRFGILHRANYAVVANKNRLANHLTEEGRQSLFGDKYPLAWGNKSVAPSLFVTGLAQISPDLKSLTITLSAFGENGRLEPIVEPLQVATTRRTLVDAGYSYVLTPRKQPELYDGSRGGTKSKGGVTKVHEEDDKISLDEILVINSPVVPEPKKFTAESALQESPVKLTIKYADEVIPVSGDRVREPNEKDPVSFIIENSDPRETYAVVLKINGKNSLFGEEGDPARCMKWILAPASKVEIKGFQEDNNHIAPFKILSTKESEENVIRYGDLVGTLRLVVFRGEQVKEDPSEVERKEMAPRATLLAAVARGAFAPSKDEDKPGSLTALKADLLGREKGLEGARGVVGKADQKEEHLIERIYFKPLPSVAIVDATIRYYTPTGKN